MLYDHVFSKSERGFDAKKSQSHEKMSRGISHSDGRLKPYSDSWSEFEESLPLPLPLPGLSNNLLIFVKKIFVIHRVRLIE